MTKVNNTYINGNFQKSDHISYLDLINPSNEEIYGVLECTSVDDLEKAIHAAFIAQSACMSLSIGERKHILSQILKGIIERRKEIAEMITLEMCAPINLSKNAHIQMGIDHLENTIHVLDEYKFESNENGYKIIKMPIGVAALITPWNWPLNQTLTKIASAIAAGCAIVIKPSEYCAFSSKIIAEIIDSSDLPPGGFNMVNGLGADLGPVISQHNLVDMISFTGSTEVVIGIQ